MNRWKIRLAAIAALLTLGLSVAAAEAKKSRGVAVIANADGTIQFTTTPVTITHDTVTGGAYTIKFPAGTWTPRALPVPIFNTTNGTTISELHIGFAAYDGSETIHVTFTAAAQFNFLAFEFQSDD